MEHYPDIQRQQGTLFFIPDGDRAAIAISIERLIDLLDALDQDPDLEPYMASFDWGPHDDREEDAGDCREADYADDEPLLGATERHPNAMSWSDVAANHNQERWASGGDDDREDDGDDLEPSLLSADYRFGRIEVDLEGDESDSEYSHGWTAHIDQNKAMMNCGGEIAGEGEPDLGWSGHGTGWMVGDDPRALEACQLGNLELEFDAVDDGSGFLNSETRAPRSLGVDPALLPERFVCACEGDCLEPLIGSGTRLQFDKQKNIEFDSLVMIVRKPGTYCKGEHQAVVKRFIADTRGTPNPFGDEGGVLAEMLNPHRLLFYPASTIATVIACTGTASEEVGPRLSAGEILARRAINIRQASMH